MCSKLKVKKKLKRLNILRLNILLLYISIWKGFKIVILSAWCIPAFFLSSNQILPTTSSLAIYASSYSSRFYKSSTQIGRRRNAHIHTFLEKRLNVPCHWINVPTGEFNLVSHQIDHVQPTSHIQLMFGYIPNSLNFCLKFVHTERNVRTLMHTDMKSKHIP